MFSSQRRRSFHSKSHQSRRRFRQGLLEQLEPRLVMDSQWQNPARSLDVNNDGLIAPLDALLLINKLNTSGSTELPPRTNPLDFFYDTNGDSRMSPIDALLVINQLNSGSGTGDPRVPGETETGPAGFLSMPLTTMSGVAGQVVRLKADLTIGQREFNEMGVFVVDNASGSINGVMPTSIDYAKLAFTVAQRRVLFSRRDEFKLSTTVDLPAGQNLRVYVLQSANSSDGDAAKHMRVRTLDNGGRRVAWEEFLTTGGLPTVGDRGFDDAFVDMHFDAPLNINSTPVISSLPDRSIPELTTLTFSVSAFDADLPVDQIRYTLDSAPTGATLNASTGEFSWTPTEGQGPGIFTVIVRATDRSGASDTEAIDIEVQEVNLAPSLVALPDVDLRPGDTWQASASASDPDLPVNTLTYALAAGAPAGLTIDSRTGAMRFTAPSTDRQATYPVTVIVRDNGSPSLSDSRSFNIRVTAQRTAPVLDVLPNITIPEMVERTITIAARDLDLPDDTLSYTLVSGPVGATLNSVTGLLRWTPTEAQGPGPFPVTVRATDRDGNSDSKSFTITVTEVNRSPSLVALSDVDLRPGDSWLASASASDPDLPANTLTYSLAAGAPVGMTIDSGTGVMRFTAPSTDRQAAYPVTVIVRDNGSPSLSDSRSFNIRVTAQRTAPVLDALPNITIPEMVERTIAITAQDLDLPDDALNYALVSGPVGATSDQATGLFRWTPTEAQGPGTFPVTVRVTDRDGRSDSKSFTITVTEVNRPPVLEPLTSARITAGQSFSFAARATDPDLPLNTLTFSISGNAPPGYTFNTATGQFNWTAPANSVPTQYSFFVQVIDNGSPNLTDIKPVSITVDLPVIEMEEADRFVTQTTLPVTLGAGISQLQFSYDDLIFDRQDGESINDAFELSLVDGSGRPLVGIINPNRDGLFNRSEELAPQLADGVAFTSDSDGNGGTVRWNVSHLPEGTSANLIVRLVNNDADNTTRVKFVPQVEQIAGAKTLISQVTPPAWADSLNVLNRSYSDTDWRHLSDVTSGLTTSYEFTAYDIDTQRIGASVVLRNTSGYPIRGPLLVTGSGLTSSDARLVNSAGMLPRDTGQFGDPMVAQLAGAEFFDATGALAHTDIGSALLPGESVRFLLEFENSSNTRFDYQLHVLGFLNNAPRFDTQAPSSVRVGNQYRYDSGANDVDLDLLTYSMMSGPSGMSVDSVTGMVTWTPTASDVGTHSVQLRTVDPFGASDLQQFTIDVVSGNALNRPPAFVTDPIVEAMVGVAYAYPSRAIDPDFDSLSYTIVSGPVGMSILAGPSQSNNLADPAGNVAWVPEAKDIGKYVPVTLKASDGRGGEALQDYRIYVRPSTINLPPVIVTTPQIDFDWAGPLGTSSGAVTPKVIELDLEPGQTASPLVSIQVPAQLPLVDVFLLFDDTGSFKGTAPQLASAFPKLIDNLRNSLTNVDLGFGVGRFEDYGGSNIWTSSVDRPFILNQPILPASMPGMRDAIVQALSRTAPGDGGDDPESLIEALYQVATGLGFDGNNDGSLLESGLAGMIRTQTTPGSSGDVPPFLPGNFDRYRTNAIRLPFDTTLNVPAIATDSSFAFKFNATAGDLLRFTDSASSTESGQWILVNDIGRVIGTHRRGQPFIESFSTSGEVLLIPRSTSGTVPATTMRMTRFEPITSALPFDQDMQFTLTSEGDRRRYTFSLTDVTPVVFDAIAANTNTTWTLSDGVGNVFSSRMLGGSSSDVTSSGPLTPGSIESTADQSVVLQPGNYTLTFTGVVSTTPTMFRATRFAPGNATTVAVGNNVSLPVTKERLHWLRVDGQTGQSFVLSRQPALVLDASGLPLARIQSTTGTSPSYGTLKFGQQPTFWIAMTSSSDETLSFSLSQASPAASLPTAAPVTIGATLSGQVNDFLEHDFEITLSSWQLVKVAASRGSFDWRLSTEGGARWAEQSLTSFDNVNFLNNELLLPPGRHRLTLQLPQFAFDPRGNYEFTVTANPFTTNTHVADASAGEYVPSGPGTRGGAGFRSGAVPIILVATDIDTAYQPDGVDPIVGVNNLRMPLSDLVTQGARNETPQGRGASIQRAIDALIGQGALVIGLGTNELSGDAPRKTLEAISRLTGATNASSQTIANNTLDAIAPGDPLYFQIDGSADVLTTGVTTAIEAAIKATPTNVNLVATETRAGFTNETGQVPNVRPGGIAEFKTKFLGDGQAHVFDLQFVRTGSSEVIGTLPVAINDRYRYDSRAIDPENDPVTLELIGDTHGAKLDTATGKILWRPPAPGSYTFTLQARDTFGGTDVQTWTVNVGDVRSTNVPPVLPTFAPVIVSAGASLRMQVEASDNNPGDQLHYSFLGPSLGGTTVPVGMTIDGSTGQIDWTPTLSQVGQNRVTVRVTDAHGGFDDKPLVIEVQPPAADNNRNPAIISSPVRSAVIDRGYRYDVDATDLDQDALTYSLVIAPRGMVIDSILGIVGWNPTEANLGTHDVLVKVADGRGGVAFQSYQLFVGQTNDPPEIISRPSGAAAPGSAWNYLVVATDPNGDVLRYSLVAGQNPAGTSIDASTGLVTWTPTTTGAYRFMIEASDGRGGRARQEFTLPVSDSAPPAIVSKPTGPARVGQRYETFVVATDPNKNDSVTLSLDAISIARGATLSAAGCPADAPGCAAAARLVWTPDTIGDFPITITATDRDGNTATQNFTLSVVAPSSPSQPPRITSRPTGPAIKDQAWTYPVTAIDPDGDVVQYRLGQSPAGMTIDRATGLVRWTPTALSNGTSVEVVAEDARGAWSMQSFDLPVIQRSNNAAPIFTSIPTGPAQVGQSWSYQASAFDPDGDTVTYSLDAAALTAGLSIDKESGLVTWTPSTSGEQPLTVTAQDAYGGRTSQIITLSVNPKPNLPPQFLTIPTGPAIVGQAWTYAARANDPEGDSLRYSLAAGTPTSVSIDALTGRVTYTPTAVGSTDITVIATDTAGNRAQQQFSLPSVNNSGSGSNRPPVFASEPIGPARLDQVWIYMALALDADGDAITYALDGASLAAGLTIGASTGRVAWTPRALGNRTIEVQARDAAGNVTTQRFDLPVVRDNRSPVIESQPSGPVLVGRAWSYSVVASDPDGDTVSLSLDAASLARGVTLSGNQVRWTPTATGNQTILVTASDGRGGQATQTIQLTVGPASTASGNAPRFRSLPPKETAIGQPLNYRADAFDPDGTSVRYQLTRGVAGMSIDSESGQLSWRPEQLGQASIEITAIDQAGEMTAQAFTLNVVPANGGNAAPVITSTPRGPAVRNLLYRYPVVASDPNGDALTYAIDAQSQSRGIAIAADGLMQWLPTTAGDYPITLTVRDVHGAVAEQSFTLSVISNAPPQITSPAPQRLDLGQTLNYTVTAIDPNPGDTISYSMDSLAGATINAQSGLLTWQPTAAGRYTFSVFATDNHQARDEQAIELLVVDPANNRAPTIDGSPRSAIALGVEYLWQVPATDPDGDAVAFELVTGPTGLTVDARGLLRWKPDAAQVISGDDRHTITVKASDGRGGSDTKTWRMAVTHSAGNQAPVITRVQMRGVDYDLGDPVPAVIQYAVADRAYQALFTAVDPEGDTLVWSLVDAPSSMRIDARGLVDYRPTTSDVGEKNVQVRVTDAAGASGSFTYKLTVRAGNTPARIAGNPPVQHKVSTLYSTTFTATDIDNDPVTFRFVAGQPSHGAVLDASSGKLTWTPTTAGTYRFFVAAVDPLGEGTQLVFDVLVDAFGANAPPRFEDTQPGVAEVDVRYSRRFPAVDPDGDTLTYAIEEGPAGMTIAANDGTITWNAPAAAVGTSPLVKLTAKDPAGQTARYQFRLPVRAANSAPRFDSTPLLSVTAGNIYRTDVSVSDADGDPLTLKLLNGPSGLTLDESTGRISWTTVAGSIGTHAVKVSVTDGRISQPLEQSWTITVAADSAKPQIKLLASSTVIDIGTEVSFEVRASDNVAVTARTLKIATTNIALSSSGFGKFTFTSAGRLSAIATASDAAGNLSTDQLSILVRDPNNAAPQVVIGSPIEGQQLTAPTDVALSVTDTERDLTSVRLLFAPADGSADFRQFAFLTAATGQKLENFTNKVIGKFDPTNLANGSYIIRAVAEDAGFNQTTRETTVQVAGRLKLGNFAASFDDLTIPVSGMPITIVRSYDTLDAATSGDFGNGWKLDIKQARVRIDASTLGGVGSGRYQAFVNGTRVFVKTPDGTEEGFTFRAVPDQTLFGNVLSWKSNFDPDRGNNYKLEAPAGDLKLLGDEFLSGYGTTYNPQDPEFGNVFQVTSIASRITYNVNATTGETGSIQDRNENKLTLRYDGIISNTGRSVTFQRDMQGRIVAITDPRGNSLRYGYDAAGDLVRSTDRMGNTVRMTYLAEPAHYLNTVLDPLGNVALKASYKLDNNGGNEGGEGGSAASGRLSKLEDATGSYTAFEQNPQELRQTQRDEKGIVSTVQYDNQGNPLEVIERGGNRTIRTFDDPVRGLPTTETQVIGQPDSSSGERDDITVRRTYNQWGQVTSETDDRGNVTRYLYNSEGVPTSTVNPDGSSTYYSYDDKFNLTYTSSSAGGATSMTYDKAGQVTEVRSGDLSANGNVVKLNYNRFGEVIETQDTEQNKRSIAYDANGNNVGTEFQWIDPSNANNKVTLKTSSVVAPNDQPQSTTSTSGTSRVEFDTLNRPFRSIDENGLVSETVYDLRGLAIETRTQSLNANGAAVWMVNRTVYNDDGQAIYSTDSLPEGTTSADIGGTQSIYDDAGRIVRTERRQGVDIQITGTAGKLSAKLNSAGRMITTSETQYDSSGRAWQTIDNYGRKSQTLFDRFGQTIESRSQSYDENGTLVWLTSRSVYDSLGRVLLSTDRYVVPANTELGAGASPASYATATLYDNQGRSIGSQRIGGAVVTITGSTGNQTSAITTRGTQLHESKTIYDTRGRVSRSISPTGQITDYVYDARDRQIATIGHPLPAEEVGLGSRYPGKMVRLRSETEFDRYGRVATQITNVIQVENSNGSLVTVDATDARRTRFRYDAEGRQIGVTYPDGTSSASEYDKQGRMTAEIDPLGSRKDLIYNSIGQLVSVQLPTVPNPLASNVSVRPTYQYSYDPHGQMSQLVDANGNVTKFGFDAKGQSSSRTLPNGQSESFVYDDRQRQVLQVTFEGAHKQTLYDDSVIGGGRVLGYNLFASQSDYARYTSSGTLAGDGAWERIRMTYDAFGRVISIEHAYVRGAAFSNPQVTVVNDRWTNRYDAEGRMIEETSPTGFIRYEYDTFGRKTKTLSGTSSTTVLSEVTYGYDALSRVASVLTVRRNGVLVDSDATQAGSQPEATRYHFDLLGRPDYTELPNQVVEDYLFDNMDRLDVMAHYRSDTNNADLTDNALKDMFDYSYRADGKRVGLVERFDTSGTGIRPGSSTLSNNYTWTYDNAGRLTRELLDSSDNTLDQTESFLMDLVGNRIRRTLDKPGTANDTTDIYTYDGSDRLLNEQRYSGLFATGEPTGSPTQTTTYTWNATQQASKTVSVPFVSSVVQTMSYGLSGQLERVVTTTQDGAGQVTDRKQVEYRYDPQGIRFIASDYIYNLQTSNFLLQTSTEYLIDHANFTGYQQTIIETTKNASGQTTKRITYTYGLDEITQTTTGIDPVSGLQSPVSSLTFAHDGHGSTRVLFEAAAVIAQIYTYSAYGELIALHNSLGSNLTSQASPLTSVLYNGESLDPTTSLYNFRARWYSAGNGRFQRLDPFAGNRTEPLSYHKYGFVHGDPVQGLDPSGLSFAGNMISSIGSMMNMMAHSFVATMNARRAVVTGVTLVQNALVASLVAMNVAAANFKPDGWILTVGLGGQVYGIAASLSAGLYGDYRTGKIYGYVSAEAGLGPLSTMKKHSSVAPGLAFNFGFAFNVKDPQDIGGLDFNAVFPMMLFRYGKYLNPFNTNKMHRLLLFLAQVNNGNWSYNPGAITLGQSSNFSTAVVLAGRKGFDWGATVELTSPLLELADIDSITTYLVGHGFSNDDSSQVRRVIEYIQADRTGGP